MLETIQVMDWTMVAIFGCTYGIVLEPKFGATAVCPALGSGMHQVSSLTQHLTMHSAVGHTARQATAIALRRNVNDRQSRRDPQ
jgi:hypothetical protein